GGRLAAAALRLGDFVALAVPRLLGAPLAGEASAPGIAGFAAPPTPVGPLAPQPRLLLVQVEQLQRLRRAHRRDRQRIVAAPGVVAVAGRVEGLDQGPLDPVVALLQREAHLARERRVVLAPAVERGVGEAGGAGREADVGGGAERGEERLPGVAVDAPDSGRGGAELEAAIGEADEAGFGGVRSLGACLSTIRCAGGPPPRASSGRMADGPPPRAGPGRIAEGRAGSGRRVEARVREGGGGVAFGGEGGALGGAHGDGR